MDHILFILAGSVVALLAGWFVPPLVERRRKPDHPALRQRVVVSLAGEAAGIEGIVTEDLGEWLRVEQARALPVGLEPRPISGSVLVPAHRVEYLQLPG